MQGVAAILFVPYFLSLLYVFGVQAKFVNPVKATIRYSFFVAMRNMKTTIQLAILMILFVWVNTTTLLANFLTLIYGIGLMGYFYGMYYKHTFAKYIEAVEERLRRRRAGALADGHEAVPTKTEHNEKELSQ